MRVNWLDRITGLKSLSCWHVRMPVCISLRSCLSAARPFLCMLHPLLLRHICNRHHYSHPWSLFETRQTTSLRFLVLLTGPHQHIRHRLRARKSVLRPKSPGLLHCITLYIHLIIALSFIEITHNQSLKRLTHLYIIPPVNANRAGERRISTCDSKQWVWGGRRGHVGCCRNVWILDCLVEIIQLKQDWALRKNIWK